MCGVVASRSTRQNRTCVRSHWIGGGGVRPLRLGQSRPSTEQAGCGGHADRSGCVVPRNSAWSRRCGVAGRHDPSCGHTHLAVYPLLTESLRGRGGGGREPLHTSDSPRAVLGPTRYRALGACPRGPQGEAASSALPREVISEASSVYSTGLGDQMITGMGSYDHLFQR